MWVPLGFSFTDISTGRYEGVSEGPWKVSRRKVSEGLKTPETRGS